MHEWFAKANTWWNDGMKEWLNMQMDKQMYQGVWTGNWSEQTDIKYIANQVAGGDCLATCVMIPITQ